MKNNIQIKKATKKDIKSILELNLLSINHQEKFLGFLNRKKNIKPPLKKKILENFKNKNLCYLLALNKNNESVGIICCQIINEPLLKIKKLGLLTSLYINKDFRKQGIAKNLVKNAFKWFKSKKVDQIDAYVYLENKIGHKFWEQMGLKTVSTIKTINLKEKK